MDKNYKAAVVSNYSFGHGYAILCQDEDEAIGYLKKVYEEEVSSEKGSGHEFRGEISEDGRYAKITNYRRDGNTDTSEWKVVPDVFTLDSLQCIDSKPAGKDEADIAMVAVDLLKHCTDDYASRIWSAIAESVLKDTLESAGDVKGNGFTNGDVALAIGRAICTKLGIDC